MIAKSDSSEWIFPGSWLRQLDTQFGKWWVPVSMLLHFTDIWSSKCTILIILTSIQPFFLIFHPAKSLSFPHSVRCAPVTKVWPTRYISSCHVGRQEDFLKGEGEHENFLATCFLPPWNVDVMIVTQGPWGEMLLDLQCAKDGGATSNKELTLVKLPLKWERYFYLVTAVWVFLSCAVIHNLNWHRREAKDS